MDKINEVLTRGVEETIVEESLVKKLNSSKKLVIKLGIDPTGSKLHLGHSVVLRKLQQFQDLGHQAVLVIGDFTALIGDPSGRTQERKNMTKEQIHLNMETYKAQASKIVDFNKVKFEYNSTWFEKMGLQGVLELASKATVSQIMERKEFRERLKQNIDIPYLEMLYPLMQGYDSVHLKADVELGGTDQKFNLLMGRQIQKRYDQPEQDAMMMKLLTGTDGAKMSKSAGNFISLDSDPNDMYGKIMAITDELMIQYAELCTDLDLEEFKESNDPFNLKKKLAKIIVEIYHSKEDGEKAEKNFVNVHQEGNYEQNEVISQTISAGQYKPVEMVISSGATSSTTQAKDLIRSGAVKIDRNDIPLISDWSKLIKLEEGQIITIGKKRVVKVIK